MQQLRSILKLDEGEMKSSSGIQRTVESGGFFKFGPKVLCGDDFIGGMCYAYTYGSTILGLRKDCLEEVSSLN